MRLTGKKLASNIVQQIRQLNMKMAEDQYELARLLYTLHSGSLHLEFGYTSFNEFCSEELPISYGHALSTVKLFSKLRELKYNKSEAIDLIGRLGITKTRKAIGTLTTKKSVASVARNASSDILSFTVHLSKNEMRAVEKILIKHGLDVNQNGRRMNMRETMVTAIKASA